MANLLSFALLTFTTFVPMIDPFGNMSIFAVMTEQLPTKIATRVALKACLFALGIVLMFAFTGERIFKVFGITTNGLKIVGGIIFFSMGFDMLQARLSRTKVSDPPTEEEHRALDDIALTPLGIPLLCGPGAMTNAILQMGKANSLADRIGFVLGTIAIMVFTFVCLVSSNRIGKLLGPNANKVILRLMGLLLMVIAVESFFSGLTPIMRDMLKVSLV
jgi:multiple antibiotic resistance protein